MDSFFTFTMNLVKTNLYQMNPLKAGKFQLNIKIKISELNYQNCTRQLFLVECQTILKLKKNQFPSFKVTNLNYLKKKYFKYY